jgi:hypothetical protein
MKIFTLIFIVCVLASCAATTKTTADVNTTSESIANDDVTSGIVRIEYKGCPALIETTEDGQLVKLYPVNLDEAFKVNGLKIFFNYTPSKAPQPESCTLINKVVSVENVSKVQVK